MEKVLLRMKKLSLEDVLPKSPPLPTQHLFFLTANMIISTKYVGEMCRAMIIHRHSDPSTGKTPEELLGGEDEMPQPVWNAVLKALGVNTEEEEQRDVFCEALIYLEKLNYEPNCGIGPNEFVRRCYYIAAFQVLREIHRNFPSWNSFPFDYIEGAQNPKKDPVPIFNGTPTFKLPPRWPPFDESKRRGLGILLEEIREREGAHTQVLASEVLRLLLDKQLHPAEAMRTFLALLSNSPKQLWEICRLAPEGYLMHLIVTEDLLCKIAALITPGFVTYYMNSGAESMMRAVYFARYRRPKTTPLDVYYHLLAAEGPLYCFSGAKAIVMTCEGAVHVRIGRNIYDATIFDLPPGWYPAFLTEFSNQYHVPSNIPVSPDGGYFFTYLIWKIKLSHPVSDIEVRLFEAWWAEQNPEEHFKIVEELKEFGKKVPARCIKFMESSLREKSYITRYCLRKLPMQVINDFIANDIFCREWAEQLGIFPDEFRGPHFGDQLMPRHEFDCERWEAEAARLPESFPITPLPCERDFYTRPQPSSIPRATGPQPVQSKQSKQPKQTTKENTVDPYQVTASNLDIRNHLAAITGITDFSQLQMVHDPRINGYWVASRAEWDKLQELEDKKKKKKAVPSKASNVFTVPKTPTTPTTPVTPTTPGLSGLTANQKKKAQKKASAAKKKAAAQEAVGKEAATSTANPVEPTKPSQVSTNPSEKPTEKPAKNPIEEPTKPSETEDDPKSPLRYLCPPEGPFAAILSPDPNLWYSFPTPSEMEAPYNELTELLSYIKSEAPDVLTLEQSLARIAMYNDIDIINTGSNMPAYDPSNDPENMEELNPTEIDVSTKNHEEFYKKLKLEGRLDNDGTWNAEAKIDRIVAARRAGAPEKPPKFLGIPKDQVPVMDSYGMYGICPKTQQEYVSSGEWTISEAAEIYKSMLKDKGVSIKEEPKKESWILIKSKVEEKTKSIKDRVLALSKEFSKNLLIPESAAATKATETQNKSGDNNNEVNEVNENTEDLGDFTPYAGFDDYTCYAGSVEDGNIDSDNAGSTGSTGSAGSTDNTHSGINTTAENIVDAANSHTAYPESDADSLEVVPDMEEYQL